MVAVHCHGRLTSFLPLILLLSLVHAATGSLSIWSMVAPGDRIEANDSILVDSAWLQHRMADQGGRSLVVLDVSERRSYRRGHVPGAIHAYWQDTIDPYYPVYGVVLSDRNIDGARLAVLTRWGIGPNTDVVVYGDEANRYAAHVVWFLRYLGHQRASLLEGGLAAWRDHGGEISDQEAPDHVTDAIVSPDTQGRFIIGSRDLSRRLNDPALIIVDTRSADQLDETLNGSLRIGRIPGAVFIPSSSLVDDQGGRLRSADELKRLFENAGVTPDREVVIYGLFGVETGLPWLALHVVGYPSVRVYDQGWAEWARTDELPVEDLDEPDR